MSMNHSHRSSANQPHPSVGGFVRTHLHLAERGHALVNAYRQLAEPTRRLMAAHWLFIVNSQLCALFINVFLWRQSDDIKIPAIYALSHFATGLAMFWLVLLLPRPPAARRLVQLGLIGTVIQFLAFMLLQPSAPTATVLVGIIAGIGTGLYWSGHHQLAYSLTDDGNRDRFYGLNYTVAYLVWIVTPLIGGLVISQVPALERIAASTMAGYRPLFILMIAVAVLNLIVARRLDGHRLPPDGHRRVFALMNRRSWRFMMLREFLDGAYTGSITFIYVVLSFLMLGSSELSLGIFNSIFSAIGAIAALVLGGLVIRRHRDRIHLGFIGAALNALSILIFIGFFNWTGIIISSTIDVFAGPLYAVGMAATFYHAIDRSPRHDRDYYGYIVLRETMLTLGRITSIALFLLTLTLGDHLTVSKIWYLALGVVPIGFCLLTSLSDKAEKESASEVQA